ncbi:hypothetical protein FD754_009884, partial [Muntiacus muntjak]
MYLAACSILSSGLKSQELWSVIHQELNTLQMDVNRLNITLLRIFRQGVAAALGLLPQQVHINRLIEKKNSVELFVSPINRKAGFSDALPSEEVLRSLNINVLHQSLSQFGITDVSPEKNVLQGQHEADKIWSKEGFYAVVIFLSIFVIIVTCLMILYRLKEKFQLSLRQDKEKNQEIHLSPIVLQPAHSEDKTANSMVQPEQAPKVLSVVVDPQGQYTPEIKATTAVCPSPFKMKPIGLQESGKEKAFIATQGPMINTVNDFWQMVWQEDSPVIVMITKLKEKNEKCVLYWPEKRGIYGKVEVLVISVNECDNYTVRNLVLKQGSHTQRVKHYWYTSWPDHKTPDSAQPLLQLMLDVEEDRLASAGRGPVVVHCSAGIGRTGCFIATSIGCRQLREEGVVDALSIVCQLRVD